MTYFFESYYMPGSKNWEYSYWILSIINLVSMQGSTLQEAAQDQTSLSRYGKPMQQELQAKVGWIFPLVPVEGYDQLLEKNLHCQLSAVSFYTRINWHCITSNKNKLSLDYAIKGTERSASSKWFSNCKIIGMLPVRLKDGTVPRLRALLRRPGREEGESLHLWGLCLQLMSLERFGGGVGMKESARSGESKGGWLLNEGTAELLARYL